MAQRALIWQAGRAVSSYITASSALEQNNFPMKMFVSGALSHYVMVPGPQEYKIY